MTDDSSSARDSASSDPSNAVVMFRPEAYTTGAKVEGRRAAGASFLKGFALHSGVDRFYVTSPDVKESKVFADLVGGYLGRPSPVSHVPFSAIFKAETPGTVFRPDPLLKEFSWWRRRWGADCFSICGITHTTASKAVMKGLFDLQVSPLREWDALICTSDSVRSMTEIALEAGLEYLRERFGSGASGTRLHRETIPLGINCSDYESTPSRREEGRRLRDRLGIGSDDAACLFVGRLSSTQKLNPGVTFRVLREASRRSKRRLHMIWCGWFTGDREREVFVESARRMCPGVMNHFVDGQKEKAMEVVWHAADIFLGLVDNIQETFGLVPVEAMAAGLPTIVSDWNGYRESVRHGEDGFHAATRMPPSGTGDHLAWRYDTGSMNYLAYLNGVTQSVHIDVDSASSSLVRLVNDVSLRRRMGESGAVRARSTYDWSVIIPRYQALWKEMESRRLGARSRGEVSDGLRVPSALDPFELFSAYPTRTWSESDRVSFGSWPEGMPGPLSRLSPNAGYDALEDAPFEEGSFKYALKRMRDARGDESSSSFVPWRDERDWLSLTHAVRWRGRPLSRVGGARSK